MSSPNWIGRRVGESAVYIYCHSGDSLGKNGKILYENYIEEEDVKKLLSEGDASSIGPTVEECRFYAKMKDRNERKAALNYADPIDFRPYRADSNDICFLWHNGEWWVSTGHKLGIWQKLEDLMEISYKAMFAA